MFNEFSLVIPFHFDSYKNIVYMRYSYITIQDNSWARPSLIKMDFASSYVSEFTQIWTILCCKIGSKLILKLQIWFCLREMWSFAYNFEFSFLPYSQPTKYRIFHSILFPIPSEYYLWTKRAPRVSSSLAKKKEYPFHFHVLELTTKNSSIY